MINKLDDLKNTLPAVGTEGHPDRAEEATPKFVTGLPLEKGMSLSTWLQTVRFNPLLDFRSTAEPPHKADVVIIGSGVGFHLCT